MLKKFIAILLLLSLSAFAFMSCNDKEEGGTETTTTAENDTSTELSADATTTTAETTTATPTTTEPTTEAPPLVTTEVKKITFADPDNLGWHAQNQIENFRSEGGFLQLSSVGGDPFFMSDNPLDIAAEEIDVIRIKVKNMSESYECQLFFDTDVSGGMSEDKSYKWFYDYSETDPAADEWNIVEILTDECDLWEGTIKTIRFDPIMSEGDVMIEYISFEKIVK